MINSHTTMDGNRLNPFDRLPDELIEYIFLLLTYSPPIEPFNHVNNPPSPFYFSYKIHEPELRRTFKDLISLEMVCRRFYKLLRSSTFWLNKCRHDHLPIVNEPLAIAQDLDFRRLYFSNPFHPDYNLLDLTKGIGNDKLRLWNGDSTYHAVTVVLEDTPCGSEELYDAFGRISRCYATSYEWGHFRLDHIPLLRKGEDQLASINPVIEFSVCVAGRWDCASICVLQLQFSNDHIWRYERSFSNGENQWHRITYRYVDYPKNEMPQFVSIHLKGKDRQFWAGNYGTKFAQIKLQLALRGENETVNQEYDETLVQPEIVTPEPLA